MKACRLRTIEILMQRLEGLVYFGELQTRNNYLFNITTMLLSMVWLLVQPDGLPCVT